jgi:hypothetical protein
VTNLGRSIAAEVGPESAASCRRRHIIGITAKLARAWSWSFSVFSRCNAHHIEVVWIDQRRTRVGSRVKVIVVIIIVFVEHLLAVAHRMRATTRSRASGRARRRSTAHSDFLLANCHFTLPQSQLSFSEINVCWVTTDGWLGTFRNIVIKNEMREFLQVSLL